MRPQPDSRRIPRIKLVSLTAQRRFTRSCEFPSHERVMATLLTALCSCDPGGFYL
jgi:hypothetical protein